MVVFVIFASLYVLGMMVSVYLLGLPLKERRIGRVVEWSFAVALWPLTALLFALRKPIQRWYEKQINRPDDTDYSEIIKMFEDGGIQNKNH